MEQKRTPSQLLFSILFYIAGLFILAFGVAISVNAQMGISPVNSLPYVVSSVLLSFAFLHQLSGVGLGTVITALLAGKVVSLLKPLLSPIMNRLCFGISAQDNTPVSH